MSLDDIFKAYDIRGVAPDQLDRAFAVKIGRAFATFVDADTIMVGHDMRTSSPELAAGVTEGITGTGKDVLMIGLLPTDASYYAAGNYNLPVVMITASHNPPQYNGFKFTNAGAVPIGAESGLQEIRRIFEEESWTTSDTVGQVRELNVIDGYVERCLGMIDVAALKPFKIAIDAGNGMGGYVSPKVFAKTPCTVVPLYFELDGSAPNHEPNPIKPENVQDLIALVKKESCDLGLAFDGDGDRVFFIDELGGRVSASLVTAMVAKSMLQKHPGATIIYNAVCSRVVPETIEQNGGTAVMERVGHSYIKKTMKETGAVFAGEHSGHYYFQDYYRADSGLIAALVVLELAARDGRPFSQIVAEFQKYHAIEETNSEVADKAAVLARLKEQFSDAEILEFDGITFTYPDYWFNVRPSNTEPALRLNLEARTPELRDAKAAEVLAAIRE
jgi:phosphomannomutase